MAHIESKPYTCRVCDRQFTWLGNFHKHCATHAQPELHSMFSQPTIFRMGLPLPTFFNNMPINNPGFYFSNFPATTAQLSPFVGYNQVPGVLRCNICLLTFTTSRALKMHSRIHSGEKPYKCSQCHKAFARKDELHTHKYFHTGNSTYKTVLIVHWFSRNQLTCGGPWVGCVSTLENTGSLFFNCIQYQTLAVYPPEWNFGSQKTSILRKSEEIKGLFLSYTDFCSHCRGQIVYTYEYHA